MRLFFTLLTIFTLESSAKQKLDFARQVLPILSDKCFACHGPDTDESKDLRLDNYASATKSRNGKKAINPENLDQSEILVRIHSADDPMPPADDPKQLTPQEREILTQWIKEGGNYATHWAFVPPTHPNDLPEKNVIDHFISKAQKKTDPSLTLSPQAKPSTLARRASLVLTGLPPEPHLLQEYLKDPSQTAYLRLIDRLLDSPAYGEHQARYWLDAIRYGDTHGLHLDSKRGIYPYRDWVVRALNDNLPIDQFLTWQLAGDLLPNPTISQKIATGFIRMNPTTAEGGVIPAEFQAKNNFDRTETLGTVLLGMTMSCARCHTHKYDPITHKEYFSLLAFFNSTNENPLDGNAYKYHPITPAPATPQQWELLRNHEKSPETHPDPTPQFTTTTLIAQERPRPRPTRVLARGEYQSPTGPVLTPDIPAIMGAFPTDAPRNRLGLAQWLTAPDHPLTSRVLVNRIWQRTFGHGLVRTPEDFGLQGQHPTHPQLLDWLALEFQKSGWNLKKTLKLLVTSQTFQQSSQLRSDLDDPENKLYARGPSFRLDAEVIRDLGLWSSQLLDPTMGGEGTKPYQPAGLWKALMHPASNTRIYKRDTGPRLYRRSLYVYWKRTSPHPMMTLFDAPNRESSCVKRSRSSTALQSLALFNETQRVEISKKLAERIYKSSSTDQERLNQLFTLIACRPPTAAEATACLQLLTKLNQRYQANPDDAQQLLKTGDSPVDPKLPPQELAAWSQVVTTLLASDIALYLD